MASNLILGSSGFSSVIGSIVSWMGPLNEGARDPTSALFGFFFGLLLRFLQYLRCLNPEGTTNAKERVQRGSAFLFFDVADHLLREA